MAIDSNFPSMDNDPRSAREYWEQAFELWKSQLKCNNCAYWNRSFDRDYSSGSEVRTPLRVGTCGQSEHLEYYANPLDAHKMDGSEESILGDGVLIGENFGCVFFLKTDING